jgi:hypothetical protein
MKLTNIFFFCPREGSKAHLEALCKRFKQPHSAPNKAVLIARLKEFSQHKEKWQRYVGRLLNFQA